jgi:hypothetical protein
VPARFTGVQLDSKFAVSLLDFQFGGGGRHAEGVVVGGFYDHGCGYRISR